MNNKLPLTSLDIAEHRRHELRTLFPEVFTETKDNAGNLVESIDFEKLKAELGTFTELFESRRERYGLEWPGKKECIRLIQQPSLGTVRPLRKQSLDFDSTKNVFVEGDNLEVLKLLQKSMYGKVKLIYIDPPYNTGKEFIYPDKYAESLDTYLSYAGMLDEQGRRFETNTASEGRFHTRWLNMMYPRLYLARNLLSEDGVIVISIDDNEVKGLRALCDELFGEENFLAQFVWKCRQFTDSRSTRNVSTDHEYILAYAKSDTAAFRGRERDETKYGNPDSDTRGPWMSRSMLGLATRDQRPNLHYDIVDPATNHTYSPPETTGWRYSRDRMMQMIAEGRVLFPASPTGRPREKKFRADLTSQFTSFPTVIADVYTSDGTASVRELFDAQVFDFPKPPGLMKLFVEQLTGSGDIILDFFAGSCATAHAVLELCSDEDVSRQFVMIQLPEPCQPGSEAEKLGFKTISDLGVERIRRVCNKLSSVESRSGDDRQKDLMDLSPKYCDFGFRVFQLDKSNFARWQAENADGGENSLARQLEMYVDHVDPNASQDDILFEILLKAGFALSEQITSEVFVGSNVYSVADGALLICLENEVTRELIDAIAEAEPMQFICLDKAFKGNDQLKANAVQTFAARNQGREKAEQIIFRTV